MKDRPLRGVLAVPTREKGHAVKKSTMKKITVRKVGSVKLTALCTPTPYSAFNF
jgi:hypothetical protein